MLLILFLVAWGPAHLTLVIPSCERTPQVANLQGEFGFFFIEHTANATFIVILGLWIAAVGVPESWRICTVEDWLTKNKRQIITMVAATCWVVIDPILGAIGIRAERPIKTVHVGMCSAAVDGTSTDFIQHAAQE